MADRKMQPYEPYYRKPRNKPQAVYRKTETSLFNKKNLLVLFAAVVTAIFAAKYKPDEAPHPTQKKPVQVQQAKKAQPPRLDYSKPGKILVPCKTEVCFNTAHHIKDHAFDLWLAAADARNWTVPNYLTPEFALRYAGIESNVGGFLHKEGSPYKGLYQFSPTEEGSLLLSRMNEFLPILNTAKNTIPALVKYEKKAIARNITIAKQQLDTARAESLAIQHKLEAMKKMATSKKAAAAPKKVSLQAPHAKGVKPVKAPPIPTAAEIARWHEALLASQEHAATQAEKHKQSQLVTNLPVTKETLLDPAVYEDKTVQLFLFMTSTHLADRALSKKPNFENLSDKGKGAMLYLWHNSPYFCLLVLDNLDSKESVAELSARKDPKRVATFKRIFKDNSGIYDVDGRATPEEVLKRVLALSKPFVTAYEPPPDAPGTEALPQPKPPATLTTTNSRKQLAYE